MVKWVIPTRITLSSSTTTTRKTMSTRSFLAIVIVIASLVRVINGFLPIQLNAASGRAINSGTDARKLFGGYRITPKHCRATKTLPISDPRVNGPTICMFNHECAQRNGEVVGACMDGFLFGACCQIPRLQQIDSTLINDAQNAYFQNYQQKLQMQQSMSNPVAAQSYENYVETAQQSMEVSNTDPQTSSYQTTKHDFPTTNSYRPEKQPSSTTISSTTNQRIEEKPSNSLISSTEPVSKPQFNRKTTNAVHRPSIASTTTPTVQPPRVHVHKDSVKVSSPSLPPQNDELLMQVLSTMQPDHEHDRITFTTEVPTKIVGNSAERLSSESNSFEEEESPLTQAPVRLIEKLTTHKETTKTQPQQSTTHKTLQQQTSHHQQQKYQPNTHNHNHLVLDTNEFTHSDITHPGADADLVEDLQFSTGYGPQPTIVEPPKRNSLVSNYESDSNIKAPQADDKYVLVQTISNDQPNKQPITSSASTTDSSITTHVDSIESIILQLNNTNTGPVYSVIDQNNQSHGSSTTLSLYTGSSDGGTDTFKQDAYYGSNTSPSTASIKPLQAAPTDNPTSYFQEIDTKRPEDYQQDKYTGMTGQVPAYLESFTTNLNSVPENEYAADFLSESSSFGPSAYKPEESSSITTNSDESVAALNEATIPNKNYNDVADAGHQTSEFNKMPVVGIAYPVDMSYMEEDGSLNSEDSAYQKLPIPTSSQEPIQSSSAMNTYNSEPDQSSTESETTYTRLPTLSDSTSHNHKRPVPASYTGFVTPPSYNQQPLASNYNQIPEEVSVTSHTTKVEQDFDTTSYETAQTQKLTTISYVDTTVTTSKPYKAQSSTFSYTTNQLTTGSRPPYDSLVLSSSTAKPKPKPSKRPGTGNTKKTTKPRGTKRPSTTYTKVQQNDFYQGNHHSNPNKAAPTSSYGTSTENYNQGPTQTYSHHSSTHKQPNNAYNSLVNQPSNSYAQVSAEQRPSTTYKVPSQPSVSYNQEQLISSPPAKKAATRKPSTNKKPISTSYVSGPTTVRPPTTSAYDHEVPPLIIANDKLDSFVHSTAESIAGSPLPLENSYLAPVHAGAVTPLQIQGTQNGHKRPGFVKIKATTRPPIPTVIITPKPTTNTYVKQPSADSYDSDYRPPTTSLPQFGSTSYVYSPSITKRPDLADSTSEYVSLPPINSNDFYDPGYFGNQAVTKPTYAVPSDDRPAFPGYFGPTPTYPAFQIPGEKNDGAIEETYTSPNDFVNFPPVRNPNLNMSATSSAVTTDLDLSTPAFVEDGILKDKMNTLVHKIVESLQGNFEALSDIIDETAEPSTYQAAAGTTATRKPTRKPVTPKTKPTTKKPITRLTTKPPTKKPSVTTRKPVSKRTTTRKPITTRRSTKKPTPTTTNVAPFQDEIIDEEDGEDTNLSDNEIGDSDTLGVGTGGRKIQCGVRPHIKSGRIVGGKGSTFGAYPWQVLVRESTWLGLFTKNKCGGVLITNKYVITAAHCQPGFLASLVAVVGEFDISGDLESKKAVTKNVKRVIVHRQYDPATFENDLALLELESPVQFDTHIVPICMPQDTADFTGRMATVTGWGRLKYGGGVPSVLQEVQVPIIENSVCQEMFHTAGHNKKILNSFLCAGYANGQKDSCEGDSGGPLVLQRPDGRYELAGTVSHGIKCAAPYLPGVYMRTTYYKPWLRSITGVK